MSLRPPSAEQDLRPTDRSTLRTLLPQQSSLVASRRPGLPPLRIGDLFLLFAAVGRYATRRQPPSSSSGPTRLLAPMPMRGDHPSYGRSAPVTCQYAEA